MNFWVVILVDKIWCFMCKDQVNCNYYLYLIFLLFDVLNYVVDVFFFFYFFCMENEMFNYFSVKFFKCG